MTLALVSRAGCGPSDAPGSILSARGAEIDQRGRLDREGSLSALPASEPDEDAPRARSVVGRLKLGTAIPVAWPPGSEAFPELQAAPTREGLTVTEQPALFLRLLLD